MKQMRTPLSVTRLARCKAIIDGYGSEVAFRTLRDLCGINRDKLVGMLTDEAIEEWAFRLMEDRARMNRMNARNRALTKAGA